MELPRKRSGSSANQPILKAPMSPERIEPAISSAMIKQEVIQPASANHTILDIQRVILQGIAMAVRWWMLLSNWRCTNGDYHLSNDEWWLKMKNMTDFNGFWESAKIEILFGLLIEDLWVEIEKWVFDLKRIGEEIERD